MEGGEVVLRTWDVESAHNYENNQHHTQVSNINHEQSYVSQVLNPNHEQSYVGQ